MSSSSALQSQHIQKIVHYFRFLDKIEYIFVRCYREIDKKEIFLVQRSVPENFQWENFLGVVATAPLRTQNSVYSILVYSNVLALGDQPSVSNS